MGPADTPLEIRVCVCFWCPSPSLGFFPCTSRQAAQKMLSNPKRPPARSRDRLVPLPRAANLYQKSVSKVSRGPVCALLQGENAKKWRETFFRMCSKPKVWARLLSFVRVFPLLFPRFRIFWLKIPPQGTFSWVFYNPSFRNNQNVWLFPHIVLGMMWFPCYAGIASSANLQGT